jgi:hypothetical protein
MPRISVRARSEALAVVREHGAGATHHALGAYNSAVVGKMSKAHLQYRFDILRGVLEVVHRRNLAPPPANPYWSRTS